MKTNRIVFLSLPCAALILCLLAWNTPNYEDIDLGTSNTIPNQAGQTAVIGAGNTSNSQASLVVGNYNEVTKGETVWNKYSLVVGSGNKLKGDRSRLLVTGNANTVNANNSFVAGTNNTMEAVAPDVPTNSCAIGSGNQVATPHGYAMGYNNIVTSDHTTAIGYGNEVSNTYGLAFGVELDVNQSNAVAVGRYNTTMTSGDVFVVGTGNSTTRNTALKATSDSSVVLGSATSGKVVLARAQGDISMGQYTN
jgi:trimeric autotransporter adhesin